MSADRDTMEHARDPRPESDGNYVEGRIAGRLFVATNLRDGPMKITTTEGVEITICATKDKP